MNETQISYIEIPFYLKTLNPDCLYCGTKLGGIEYHWFLDRSVKLSSFIKDVTEELKKDFGLTERDRLVLRIRDKSDWQDELGLRKLTTDVINGKAKDDR